MFNYDKDFIKQELTTENIFSLLEEWGGEPEYTNYGILSTTICHNLPGEGSRKLYYYSNSGDQYELIDRAIKDAKKYWNLFIIELDLGYKREVERGMYG